MNLVNLFAGMMKLFEEDADFDEDRNFNERDDFDEDGDFEEADQNDHNMHSSHSSGNHNHDVEIGQMANHNAQIHNPDAAQYTAVSSGDWTNPGIWEGGAVPTENATVAISTSAVVTVDTVIQPRFKSIAIDGTLRFATDVNTELWVDTLTSGVDGVLEVGTAVDPIAPNVTARVVFADLGPIDKSVDPHQLGRGAVLHGQTTMMGAPKTHRITVGTFPKAGDSTLVLSSVPTGWRIGDVIVVTGSQGNTSDEVRVVTNINGETITLDRALELDHVPPKSDLNLWVANLTRNIIFESENKAEVLRRGHMMFMHTNLVDINNASFIGLGRTDKRIPLDDVSYEIDDEMVGNGNEAPIHFTVIPGPANNIRGRYALHVHRAGTSGTPAIYKGSVVVDSVGWGFVNHSSNVQMIDNVSYDVQGAGFYTEAGDEVGSIVGNIAIRTVNEAFTLDDLGAIDPDLGLDRGDFGREGDGIWLSGNRVSVIDNVVSGTSAHGIIFWVDGLIEPDLGRSSVQVSDLPNGHLIPNRLTVPVWWAPVAEVRDNEIYGATVGFRSRYIHAENYMGDPESDWHAPPPQAYIDTLNPVFDGITVWGSRDGLLLNYNERISVRNVRLIGMGVPFWHNLGRTAAVGVGFDLQNENTLGPGFIENVSIEGYEMGFLMPRQSEWTVQNLSLSNVIDMLFHEARREPRTVMMTNVSFGSLDNTAVSGREGSRFYIVLDPHFDDITHDANALVFPDTITLDGRELFLEEQVPSFIPYAEPFEDGEFTNPPLHNYVGKTNQQLWDMWQLALGGELLPQSAVEDPAIYGGFIASGAPIEIPHPPGEGDPTQYEDGPEPECEDEECEEEDCFNDECDEGDEEEHNALFLPLITSGEEIAEILEDFEWLSWNPFNSSDE